QLPPLSLAEVRCSEANMFCAGAADVFEVATANLWPITSPQQTRELELPVWLVRIIFDRIA
ncbi:MAG: hypothetical protein KDA42_01980, partial [Planctomycetales bacterium]|nr:hypothetical protein [Planctomycetales bacterium]